MGAIPPSPIISCLGRLADVNKAITSGFKETDSAIMLVGKRKDELGGGAYYALFDALGKNIPRPNLAIVEAEIWALTDLIDGGLVLAAHDISDGGVAVALAEMSFENDIGFEIEIEHDMRADKWLFSQTGGFVLEIDKINIPAIISIMSSYKIPITELGRTSAHQVMEFGDVIYIPLARVKDCWSRGLRDKLK